MRSFFSILLALVVICIGIVFRENLEFYFNRFLKTAKLFSKQKNQHIFTSKELAEYNGVTRDAVYLAIIGTIFDVSKGLRHYGEGSPYHYFVGKDGSRAFITGDFKDESDKKDHILDLSCDELLVVLNWKKTLKEKYKYVGIVIGRYYDNNGKETEYMNQFYDRLNHCKYEKDKAKQEERKYPPCNISWSAEEGTTVWCTKSSGGVTRSWAGVPRQLYTPGEDRPRCVCVNVTNNNQAALFKEYENCSSASTLCYLGH